MDGVCALNSTQWGGVSTPAAVLFTNLLTTLMGAQQDLGNPSVYPQDATPLLPEYDFIVVGAGSAGSVLASRLSEAAQWNVLLVEAGGDPPAISEIPVLSFTLPHAEVDWAYRTQPDEKNCRAFVDNRCVWSRGKVLGGTSTINGNIYMRGHKCDYDRWASQGNTGWSYEDVLPYFKKSEDFQSEMYDPHYHNTGGYLTTTELKSDNPLVQSLIDAGIELGLKRLNDLNGKDTFGIGKIQATIRNGTRCSTAKAFLSPSKSRINLHVTKHSQVTKILIHPGTKKVYGIQFYKKDHGIVQVNVSKEVILSAGVINSPQLLMLSGIGPRDHLQNIGIQPIVHDLKVGENLHDHPAVLPLAVSVDRYKKQPPASPLDITYQYLAHRSGPFSNLDVSAVMSFIDTKVPRSQEDENKCPDIQFHHFRFPKDDAFGVEKVISNLGYNLDIADQLREANKISDTLLIVPVLMSPKSRGRILLNSTDPLDYPLIYPGYFQDPDDLETLISGVEFAVELTQTEALRKHEAELFNITLSECNHLKQNTREFWRCWVPRVGSSYYHPVGTCKMGPASDPEAVVDPTLKVHGITGLRVADASIMPTVISGNTNAPCIMIGEKAADLIKQEWLSKGQCSNMGHIFGFGSGRKILR